MNLRKIEDTGNPNDPTSKPSPRHLSLAIENPLKSTGFSTNPSFFQEGLGKKPGSIPSVFQSSGDEDHVLNNLTDMYPQYDKTKNYYQEFWKIYLHNEILIGEMKEQANEIKNLKSKIAHTEELHKQISNAKIPKSPYKKKNRRTADEIVKEYLCPYPKCNKTYGSDVSLNLHIKIKHGGGNKTEREKLARSLIMAEMNGEKQPEITLNLPPGYLQQFKEQNMKKFKKRNEEGDSQNSRTFEDYDEEGIFKGLRDLKKKS